jgi:threonine aldolase
MTELQNWLRKSRIGFFMISELEMKRGFGSDNHSGVHPRIFSALLKSNLGHQPSYGTDPLTSACEKMFRELFGANAESHFVFNGTAANVLAIAPFVQSYHSILASEHAHLINDECGAPEKALGCKVVSVAAGKAQCGGKLEISELENHVIRRGDQHFSQARVISITQPTELGCVYTLEEIRSMTQFAHANGLIVHMDGARLVNAAVSLGVSLKEMTTDCGVDVVSVGGTKNGLMFGEAVVFLKPPSANLGFKFQRKQLMQLPSKTRFIAAQFLEFLGTDLWKLNSSHANKMALLLSDGLRTIPAAEVTQPTQANAVFVKFPKSWISPLREKYFFYVWNEKTFECRLMTSFDTEPADIEKFLELARTLQN